MQEFEGKKHCTFKELMDLADETERDYIFTEVVSSYLDNPEDRQIEWDVEFFQKIRNTKNSTLDWQSYFNNLIQEHKAWNYD